MHTRLVLEWGVVLVLLGYLYISIGASLHIPVTRNLAPAVDTILRALLRKERKVPRTLITSPSRVS